MLPLRPTIKNQRQRQHSGSLSPRSMPQTQSASNWLVSQPTLISSCCEVESSEKARKVLECRMKDGLLPQGTFVTDICGYRPDDETRFSTQCLTGGFPCQAVSLASEHKIQNCTSFLWIIDSQSVSVLQFLGSVLIYYQGSQCCRELPRIGRFQDRVDFRSFWAPRLLPKCVPCIQLKGCPFLAAISWGLSFGILPSALRGLVVLENVKNLFSTRLRQLWLYVVKECKQKTFNVCQFSWVDLVSLHCVNDGLENIFRSQRNFQA